MNVKETIGKANGLLAKLPFQAMAEKIPAGARAQFPLLDKVIPFANQIACGLAAVLVVTVIACSGGGGGKSGGGGKEYVVGGPHFEADNTLNIRSEPDTSKDNVLISLAEGDKVTLLEKGKTDTMNGIEAPWFKVRAGEEYGKVVEGWTFSAYLVSVAEIEKAAAEAEKAAAQAEKEMEAALKSGKNGKAIAEKLKALEAEDKAGFDKILKEEVDRNGATEYAGQEAAKRYVSEVESKIDPQIKALKEQARQLSVPEYRNYVEAYTGKLPEREFEYRLTEDGKGVLITGYNELGGDVTIPAELEGFPVTQVSISNWGDHRWRITSVVIPDTVTRLDGMKFGGLSGLQNVTLPKDITKIPEGMFRGSYLTSFTVPSGVTEIGSGAFRGCTRLASVVIPDGVTKIGDQAFEGCTSLASVTLPGSIKTFYYAFEGCTSLASVTISEGVTTINEGAFSKCTSLTSVTIPDSVMEIGRWAFRECTSLVTVTVSPVKRNWGEAFLYCPKVNLASQAALKAAGYTGSF